MGPSLDAPILITGRGGSGTRLAADLAIGVGVFLGNELNKSSDSLEYEDAVKALMREKLEDAGHGTDTDWLERWRATFRDLARSVLAAGSWPAGRPWGWKLPELMFVLPEMCSFFPGARVIHLARHPVDSSLRRTHMTSRLDNPVGATTLPAAYRGLGLDPERIGEHEKHMHNAVAWEYQVGTVARWGRSSLPPERYLEIRYEDICRDAAEIGRRVATFTGGVATGAPTPAVDPARMRSYELPDPRAAEVWALCGHTASLLGYSLEDIEG
jgi:hypothetical protein